jgi:hypothetical protein
MPPTNFLAAGGSTGFRVRKGFKSRDDVNDGIN